MLGWIIDIWDKFGVWVTNQPTFVHVAVGIGLFYAVLQILKLSYKIIVFLFAPLSASSRRIPKQKNRRPMPRRTKTDDHDDEKPPFVFR